MIYTRSYAQSKLNQIRSEFETFKRIGDVESVRDLLADIVDVSTSKVGNDPEVQKSVQDLTCEIDNYLLDMREDLDDI